MSVLETFEAFCGRVNLIVAIDHSGRAGNGFFQAIFDQHPQVLTCPWMHYLYSYTETEFGSSPVLDSEKARVFFTTSSYFRLIHSDLDQSMSGEITRFGGDPAALINRKLVQQVFRQIFASRSEITRRDAILAIYFSYAIGVGRSIDEFKYVLVTDAITLRTENPRTSFSGRILDRAVNDFSSVRIVQLVRDPRAGFASTNHQYVNSAGNMYGLHWGNYWDSVRRLLQYDFDWERVFVFGFLMTFFYQSYLAIERQKARYREHIRLVRNEDLNLNFAEATRSICEWLCIVPSPQWATSEYVPTMVGQLWTGTGAYNSTYQKHVYGPLQNDPQQIAKQVTGPNEYVTRRWRTRLAPHEIYLIEWVLREEIEGYGYDFVELRKENSGWCQFLCRLLKPLRGELPTMRWILNGRHVGWRDVADRLFFTVSFLPFYIGVRIQVYRLIRNGSIFSHK